MSNPINLPWFGPGPRASQAADYLCPKSRGKAGNTAAGEMDILAVVVVVDEHDHALGPARSADSNYSSTSRRF